ncbi:GTP-binding protein [Robertmurraya yapensis]|uniref:GTP-binding protein n=2 Tax=Bacillus yapensis TaxID=2492960 RepID=A0A431W4Y5_9BACI|nr:GTP-binding protein [Bacillus yapensis]TKS95328.1 GTP-binding protein [Bacillus yapensis]
MIEKEIGLMKKIPVYMISGFLGSGKTTVLLNMLKEFKMNNLQPGIILNELGEINVESHLFENQQVRELLNGCICCTIQDDLKATLNEFIAEMSKNNIDVLLIEGTGVANPLEIKETLLGTEYTDYFELHSMISLVDASQFLEYQSVFSSSAEVRKLLKEQISSATIVLLNKIDLVKEQTLTKVEGKIREQLESGVPIHKTKFGVIPVKELFLKRYSSSHNHDDRSEEHHHQNHHHHSTINALRIDNLPVIKKRELESWLKRLPKTVLRGKGIIQLEEGGGFYNFQFSSGTLLFEKIRDSSTIQPTMILIGEKLNKDEILEKYHRTFKTKSH